MKICIVLFGLLALALAEEKYTSKWDNIDLDQILKNDRLLNNYIDCVLEKGSCTPDGSELKRVLPDALENDCAKCSEKQREGSKKVIRHLIQHKRQAWIELEAKFDKNGLYRKRHEAELKEAGL
ncbi:ejaculatory bulb-specific protein 3-like [Aethina tumida]|uniref:ejaculatory bulb-specific protein 3-like n=1 Tax=Aethina tumida TaxID=116153 RepID=UPI00096B09D4|nr:ejaculatory bulb-specific protein 3-like [Aethina tumida]